MNQDEILDNLRTILELPSVTTPHTHVFYAFDSNKQGILELKYYNETVGLLIKLYQKLPTSQLRDSYLSNFDFSLIEELSIHQTSDINYLLRSNLQYVFMFWIKIGRTDLALNFFDLDLNVNSRLNCVLSTLLSLLRIEPQYFNRKDLDRLRAGILKLVENIKREINYEDRKQKQIRIVDYNKVSGRTVSEVNIPAIPRKNYIKASGEDLHRAYEQAELIIKEIQKAKLEIVKIDLEGVNQEINQDKEELKRKISRFKFNEELNQCLDKFDVDYYNADSFDFKSCIAHIRTFTEKLAVSIAEKIQVETKIPPSNKIASMGTARQYFRDSRVDFLSQKQDDFLGYFYAFASDDKIGAHSLTSNREHTRIIRNTGIEIGLFLVQLLEKKITKT